MQERPAHSPPTPGGAQLKGGSLLRNLAAHGLGAFIPEAGGVRGVAFAVNARVLFVVPALLWLLAARGDSPEFRRPSRLFVTGTAVCGVVLVASAARPPAPACRPEVLWPSLTGWGSRS
ncbi:hypothetical protein [Streptomyces sp. NPDC093060]|uniref:hypothetical protein n=1 Tax=Streptomyces sp. NPDC093060 TaxID=3366019 RepID=UPI00382C4E6A